MAALSGFDQRPLAFAPGRPIRLGPPRVVLFATGTATVADAVSDIEAAWFDAPIGAARAKRAPHVIVDPATRERRQLIDTASAAYRLEESGAIPTNRLGAVQVAVVGDPAAIGALTPAELDWLGTDVLTPIVEAHRSIHLEPGPVFVAPTDGPTAFDETAWTSFGGVCGAQHVPGEGDQGPGAIDIARVLAAAGAVAGATDRSFAIDGVPVTYTLDEDPGAVTVMLNGKHFPYSFLPNNGLFYGAAFFDGLPSLDELVARQAAVDPDQIGGHDHGGHP